MTSKSALVTKIGVLIFSLGALVGLVMLALIVWADLEAFLFDSSISTNGRIRSLDCPIIISRDEVAMPSLSITNPADRVIEPLIFIHVSEGYVTILRRLQTRQPIEPGSSRTYTWEITPEDAAYDLFILIRIHQFRAAPLPARTATCGVIVANLGGLSGEQAFRLAAITSLSAMAVGLLIWLRFNRPVPGKKANASRAMVGLAGLLLLGVLAAIYQGWMLGGILLTIAVLLIFTSFAYFILQD
jgi:hypothetical protein